MAYEADLTTTGGVKQTPAQLLKCPRRLARRAGLKYVSDAEPGICRIRRGKHFLYRMPGRKLGREDVERIKSLVIPPAWNDVWICAHPYGHLQATGRDDRGRKQYLYHTRWQETVNLAKFDRLYEIGNVLPLIRRQVLRDLRLPGLCKQKVVALVVRLLDLTGIRIGNSEYLRDNESYGLTTLQDEQVKIRGAHVEFDFLGKSGVEHHLEFDSEELARLLKSCRALDGSFLFQFAENGVQRPVNSADVNAYLAEKTNGLLTAKDFRTWRASTFVAAKLSLVDPPPETQRAAKRELLAIFREAATHLGNTVTVCRKYYVHSGLTDAFMSGEYSRLIGQFRSRRRAGYLPEEQLLLHLLEQLR
jgi:DNA topoisomerase I